MKYYYIEAITGDYKRTVTWKVSEKGCELLFTDFGAALDHVKMLYAGLDKISFKAYWDEGILTFDPTTLDSSCVFIGEEIDYNVKTTNVTIK